jgi:hypothetical protein
MIKITMLRSTLVVAAAVLLLSCASAPDKGDKNTGTSAAGTSAASDGTADATAEAAADLTAPRLPVNYSSLSPEQEGSELTVTGLFSKGADRVAALVVNPESRSRVTFVLADPEGVLAAAEPADGSVITVTGIITDASATWRKHLAVVTVR